MLVDFSLRKDFSTPTGYRRGKDIRILKTDLGYGPKVYLEYL